MENKSSKPYTFDRAWNYVLWLLGRQGYTVRQLQERLTRKGAAPEDIDTIIARLQELRYVDDAVYAESYVQSRKTRKGPIALKQELYQKGVPEAVIEKTIESLDQDEQHQAAKTLLQKQRWRLERAEPQKRWGKAYAFLARRGFPSDVVKAVLEESDLFSE
jgi:regulatory protein